MKFAKVLIFLSACVLLAGCSKAGNTNNAAPAGNMTSTTTTTTTINAASPKPSVEAVKSPAETALNSSDKVAKPEDAAQGLFNAWKTKDRVAAAKFATNEAITSLYSEGGPVGLQFQGCEKEADTYLCGYYYEGGGLIMTVKGSDANGYKVTGTSFIAD